MNPIDFIRDLLRGGLKDRRVWVPLFTVKFGRPGIKWRKEKKDDPKRDE